MSSTRKTKKAQRLRDAEPSVVVVIIGATAHSPNTSPPASPSKDYLSSYVSGRFLRSGFVAIWLLVGGAAIPGDSVEPQACSSVIVPSSA